MTKPPPVLFHQPTRASAEGNENANTASTAVPKLKLSLRLPGAGNAANNATNLEKENNPPPLNKLDPDRNTLPRKITLSVKKEPFLRDEPLIDVVKVAEPEEEPVVVKRKRGRPPKNPKPSPVSGHLEKQKQVREENTVNLKRRLPEFKRPPQPVVVPRPIFEPPNPNLTQQAPHLTPYSTIGDAELSKIQRLKGHLSLLLESDIEQINHADYKRPFSSVQDMIDRLLPFHLLAMADLKLLLQANPFYSSVVGEQPLCIDQEMERLSLRFHEFVIKQNEQLIPTELKSLEQRLCLEEEKFLLEKMRAEYARRRK